MTDQFCIVANIFEEDRQFSLAEKVWLTAGKASSQKDKFTVLGLSKQNMVITKWIPIIRLSNFRAYVIAERLGAKITSYPFPLRGTREEMKQTALDLQQYADKIRAANVQPFSGKIQ